MNKLIKILSYAFVIVFSCISKIYSQKEIGNEVPEVKVMAHVTKKAIMLRWGVTTPTAWKYANKKGYIIERKTIVANNQILEEPIIKRINSTPIKPKPMMDWKAFTERDNYAAIAAQALYGEQFDVDMNEGGNGIISILNQAQALEQRFSFALYAADQNFEVAKYSGLAYVDKDIKEGERYLYTVRVVNMSNDKKKIKSGGAYIGLIDFKPLPKPQEFVGVFKDKTAILSWNFKILKRYYNSYVVEKSEDNGATFKSLNSTPVTNLSEREQNTSSRMMYVDSLFQNSKVYKYRIKGISPFGIEGPYSNIVSGKGVTPLNYVAYFTSLDFLDNGDATISWSFPKEGISELKYFKLLRSNKPKGNYTTVVATIGKDARNYKLTNLKPINYYKIVAVGFDGSERESFPKMVQPDDATPPAVPVNLVGEIDSLGVVKLNWKLNTESDFLGYRVFRSNIDDNEFTQITFKPIPNNFITDTINVKTLNKKIYYKVQSFDKRYNPSDFSEKLVIKIPDIIPPTQPVFTSFKSDKGKVYLEWVTSTSNDAKSTLLYRKEKVNKNSWQLLKELPLPKNSFIDSTVVATKTYLYTILTLDDSGLESEPITPLTITISDSMSKPEIVKFTGNIDRENKHIKLSWVYKEPNVSEYILYKASEGVQPTIYKNFKNSVNNFVDTSLIINTKYTYLLQAIFTSGAKSPIKKIELNY